MLLCRFGCTEAVNRTDHIHIRIPWRPALNIMRHHTVIIIPMPKLRRIFNGFGYRISFFEGESTEKGRSFYLGPSWGFFISLSSVITRFGAYPRCSQSVMNRDAASRINRALADGESIFRAPGPVHIIFSARIIPGRIEEMVAGVEVERLISNAPNSWHATTRRSRDFHAMCRQKTSDGQGETIVERKRPNDPKMGAGAKETRDFKEIN